MNISWSSQSGQNRGIEIAPLGGRGMHAADCTEIELYRKQMCHHSDRHCGGEVAEA